MVVSSRPTTTALSFVELHTIPQCNGITGEGIIVFMSFFISFFCEVYWVIMGCWPASF